MKVLSMFQKGLIIAAFFVYSVSSAGHVMNPPEARAVVNRLEQKLKQPNAVISEQEIENLNKAAKTLGRSFAQTYNRLTAQIDKRRKEQERAKELTEEKKDKPFENKTKPLDLKKIEQQKEIEQKIEQKNVEDQLGFEGIVQNDEDVVAEMQKEEQQKREREELQKQEKEEQRIRRETAELERLQAQMEQERQVREETNHKDLIRKINQEIKNVSNNKKLYDKTLADLLKKVIKYNNNLNIAAAGSLKDLLAKDTMIITDEEYKKLVQDSVVTAINYFDTLQTTLEDYTNRFNSVLKSLAILANPLKSDDFSKFYNDRIDILRAMLTKRQEEEQARQVSEKEKREEQAKEGYREKVTAAVTKKLKELSIKDSNSLSLFLTSRHVTVGGILGLGSEEKRIDTWLNGYDYKGKACTFRTSKEYEETVASLITQMRNYIDKMSDNKLEDFAQNKLQQMFDEFKILITPTTAHFKKNWDTTIADIREKIRLRTESERMRLLALNKEEKEKESASKANQLIMEISTNIKNVMPDDWGNWQANGLDYVQKPTDEREHFLPILRALLARKLGNGQTVEIALKGGLTTNDATYKENVQNLYLFMGSFYRRTKTVLKNELSNDVLTDTQHERGVARLQTGFNEASKGVNGFVAIVSDDKFKADYEKYKKTNS